MRIKLSVPDQLDDHERKEALNAALEAVTIANEGMIARGLAPKITGLIKAGKVKWKPEPPGDEHFDGVMTVAKRGWGDCDDLAPAYAGQLRATGVDPKARAFVKKSGPERWHALVRRGDGTIEDPSKAAGMGARVSGYEDPLAPIILPMAEERRMAMAMAPGVVHGAHHVVGAVPHWFARLDVPSTREPWAWTSMSAHPDPKKALAGCIRGARIVGEDDIDGEDDARLAVVHDLIMGADPYEVAEALEAVAGEDVDVMRLMVDGINVGNFFQNLMAAARPAPPTADAQAARMRNIGLNPDGTWFPHSTYTAREQYLSGVFARFNRGEQPQERGGRPPPRGFTMNDVNEAVMRETAARKTMPPDVLAKRIRYFESEKAKYHHQRREARQFGNVLSKVAKVALPAAGLALAPFTGPLGPLAASALSAAIPGGGGGNPLSAITSAIPGLSSIPGAQQALAAAAPPSWGMSPGVPFQPWGNAHPAFMRF